MFQSRNTVGAPPRRWSAPRWLERVFTFPARWFGSHADPGIDCGGCGYPNPANDRVCSNCGLDQAYW